MASLHQCIVVRISVSSPGVEGFAPFSCTLYGRTVRGPNEDFAILGQTEGTEPEVRNSYQYVFEQRETLDETLRIAQEELARSQTKQKQYYARERKFEAGDLVLVLLPTDSNKLLMWWR